MLTFCFAVVFLWLIALHTKVKALGDTDYVENQRRKTENLTRKKEIMTNREQIDAGIADLNEAIRLEKLEIQHKIDLMNIRITELENAADGDYAPEIQALRNAAADIRAFVDEPISQPEPAPELKPELKAEVESDEAKARADMIEKGKSDEADAIEKARLKQESDEKIKSAEAEQVEIREAAKAREDADAKAEVELREEADARAEAEKSALPSPESTPIPGSENDRPAGEVKPIRDSEREDVRERHPDDGSFSDASK